MRFFPATADDLLDASNLPNTDRTELNYRTRPLNPEQEQRLTWLVLTAPAPILASLSTMADWFLALHPLCDNLMLAAPGFLAVWLVAKRLPHPLMCSQIGPTM